MFGDIMKDFSEDICMECDNYKYCELDPEENEDDLITCISIREAI